MLRQPPNPRLERVEFELCATGVQAESNALRSGIHHRGYLPHIKREGARYFVTFRLGDSLPKDVLLRIQAERAEGLARLHAQRANLEPVDNMPPKTKVLEQIERDYFRKLEAYLDKGAGECWLRRPDIADLVANAFRFFEGKRYLLKAWVVMPNHTPVVFWPMPNHTLSEILQSWKRFTGREANKILGRTGETFWQPESFDHWIRDDVEHERCCRYVVNNPVKARLCATAEGWKWSSAWRGPK